MINLLSDTVTVPTEDMLSAMMMAPVGDDVFGEDPSVNALQEKAAEMFGKQAALFCPSGTMTNQIAIKMHTNPLDEVICDHYSHVYQYETGGYAFNSGVAMNLVEGTNGKINAQQVEKHIRPLYDWLPTSKLVVIENSCNKGGGSFYTINEIQPIHNLCKEKGLKLHLDGARLFNVLVETGESTKEVGQLFDSVSICISKGLGAPVGSLLIGDTEDIRLARRYRKVMGGGMRQAGYLAAACSYALENNVNRLKEDNNRAKQLGATLSECSQVIDVRPVQTNICIFKVTNDLTANEVVEILKENGVLCSAFGEHEVRFVTHMHISADDISKVQDVCKSVLNK